MSEGELRVEHVSVAFGGVQALCDFSMHVAAAETCALIGPNGAGKTSLLNAITGRVPLARGRIAFAGRRIDGIARHALVRQGIARTFQNLEPLDRSTVLDHLLLGTYSLGGTGLAAQALNLRSARDERAHAYAVAEEVLAQLDLETDRNRAVADLSHAGRRLVELGRALATRPRLLLLDEPAAGLSEEQTASLARRLLALRAATAVSILLIEHDMRLVEAVAQRVFVIDAGRCLTSGSPQDVRDDPRVQHLYLGV